MNSLTKLEIIKEKARHDTYFFCKEILGYQEMAEQPHRELCDFCHTWNKRKKLILLPRGAFKSSVVTVGHTLHMLAYNPNLRIMIVSENFQNSTKYLNEIKRHITDNEKFKAIYGNLKPKNVGFWKRDEITVGTATRTVGKEQSIQTSSIGQTRVGMHYDHVVMDDPVSNNNINTIDQIQKVIDYYKYMLAILDPGATITIIGTKYHYADLYGYIFENELDSFDVLIRGARYPDGTLYFPTRLTDEYLNEQNKALGSWIFSCQYMNQPIDADSAVFRQEWIRYYTEPPEVLNYFITIDPAGTTGRESDFTAILVIGIDPDSNIYVLENHQLRQTQQDWMDMVFKLVEKYKIHIDGTVSLETNALQNTYKYAFDLEMEKRKFYFSITESKPAGSNSNKEKRMSALQPFFEQGKIYLKKDMYSLIDQILRFPKSKNDDQLDALKDVLPIMFAPERQKEKPRHETNEKLTRNEKWVWEQFAKETSRKVRRTKYRV